MSLFETVVFPNVVEVVSSDNYRPLHLQLGNSSSQNTTSNGDVAGERTFLVDVFSLYGLSRDLETETNISGVSQLLFWDLLLQL